MASTDSFQHFRVLQRPDGSPWELGRGAMGVTYKAFDTNLRYDVALKVINAQLISDDSIKQRFIREARSAAQLSHPNVARVFHLGETDAGFFYAMEYVDGETVERRVQKNGPIRLDLALRIVRQVTRALIAAERQRLVHRDIKPSNIMLVNSEDAEHIQVKVIDFGLAKSIVGADLSGAITVGGFVGTPHFASPEQLKEQNVDRRSDIYSLGATLWFMITGQPPFRGAIAEVIYNHLAVPPSEEILGQIPDPVANLLRKMLAKSPSDRFQSPLELSQRLDELLKEVEPIAATSAFILPVTAQVSDPPDSIFSPGQVVADHYEVHQRWAADPSVFQAVDLRTQEMVAFRLLVSPVDHLQAELISAWRDIRHPNLVELRRVESLDRRLVVISEWIHGFTLLELLRVRRELSWPEVQVLARPFASVLDYLTDRQELKGIIKLRKTFVGFSPQVPDLEIIQHSLLSSWPAYTVKADTLDLCTDLQTAEPAETLVAGSNLVLSDHPIRQLASILYELLGGVPNPSGTGAGSLRFAPLPKLTENGNTVLRRALFDPNYFPSAIDFFAELERFNRRSFPSAINYVVEPASVAPAPPAAMPDTPWLPAGSLLPAETSADDRLAGPLVKTSLGKRGPRTWPWIAGAVGAALFAVLGYQAYEHFWSGLWNGNSSTSIAPSPISPTSLGQELGTVNLATTPGGLAFHLVTPDRKTISGTTPATLDHLSPGRYRITLSRPGWPDYSKIVGVSANHRSEITHDFQGTDVTLSSDPSGATVFIGQTELGETPLTVNLPPEPVEVTSRYGRLAPINQTITPDPKQLTAARFKHSYGTVTVTSNRSDARVRIDGVDAGHPPFRDLLSPGIHQLVVNVPNAPDLVRTISLADGQNLNLPLQFTAPSTGDIGSTSSGTLPPPLASGPATSAIIQPATTPAPTPTPTQVQANPSSSPSPLPPTEAKAIAVASPIPAPTPRPLASPLPELKLEPIAPPEPALTPAPPTAPRPAPTPPAQLTTTLPISTSKPAGISTPSANPTPSASPISAVAAPAKRPGEIATTSEVHAKAPPNPKPRTVSPITRQSSLSERQAYLKPSAASQPIPDLQRQRAKERAFSLFDTEWATKQSALKAEKEDIDYQLRNAAGPMRNQWKQKLSQWKQERAQAERDHAAGRAELKREWQ
jgi:serine/threonine protein kinase